MFHIRGYEFHEFTAEEKEGLAQDGEHVRALAERIISHNPAKRDKIWRERVKREYIAVHSELKPLLSYIDLAPKFPPRFRLKQPVVSAIVAKHFGYNLEQLPQKYATISDIDRKCRELREQYQGKTIGELARIFGLAGLGKSKNDAEKIIVAMFGGKAKKLNQIEIFAKFGLIAKSITLTPMNRKTEDMKLYKIDFAEMSRRFIIDENGAVRDLAFEDSELYYYFRDNEFLCIVFREPPPKAPLAENSGRAENTLLSNIFVGFKRLVFSDEFIDTVVRRTWDDTRDKILNGKLRDVVRLARDGSPRLLKSGDISSAPNFIKSAENAVFIRGGATDSAAVHKTETVNGIKMIRQHIWIRGATVIDMLGNMPFL